MQWTKMFSRFVLAATIATFEVTTFAASAQVETATITGTVTDQTGATVHGVKVVVVETSMNFESPSETNSAGIYRAQSVGPGTYDVSFEASGFKRLVQKGLLLKVGDVLPVNAVREVGVSDRVQVTGETTLLERRPLPPARSPRARFISATF